MHLSLPQSLTMPKWDRPQWVLQSRNWHSLSCQKPQKMWAPTSYVNPQIFKARDVSHNMVGYLYMGFLTEQPVKNIIFLKINSLKIMIYKFFHGQSQIAYTLCSWFPPFIGKWVQAMRPVCVCVQLSCVFQFQNEENPYH